MRSRPGVLGSFSIVALGGTFWAAVHGASNPEPPACKPDPAFTGKQHVLINTPAELEARYAPTGAALRTSGTAEIFGQWHSDDVPLVLPGGEEYTVTAGCRIETQLYLQISLPDDGRKAWVAVDKYTTVR